MSAPHSFWVLAPLIITGDFTALNLIEYQSELKCFLKTPGLVPSPQRWGFRDPRIGLISQEEEDLPPQCSPICPTEGSSAPVFLSSSVQSLSRV